MSFPYIKKIIVNDCFTYQNFTINASTSDNSFKHIILTGKNGSGKTTILDRICFLLKSIRTGSNIKSNIETLGERLKTHPENERLKKEYKDWNDVNLIFTADQANYLSANVYEFILSYFRYDRKVQLSNVETVTQETNFTTHIAKNPPSEDFIKTFKQYLVNKKVYQALDLMDKSNPKTNQTDIFFNKLTQILRDIFHDKQLALEFQKENFEFFLKISDERKVTFNQLPAGFSAYLSIIIDLLMRIDMIRKQKQNFSYEPAGFVLIDEPETHLHLKMQEEILPFITQLFPNLQLIVATHSPAIISSLANAVVYDLTTQEKADESIVGSSYSDLMITHFGLDNEFSSIADKILYEAEEAVAQKDIQKLKQILIDNEPQLTPSLKLEIESRIIEIESYL